MSEKEKIEEIEEFKIGNNKKIKRDEKEASEEEKYKKLLETSGKTWKEMQEEIQEQKKLTILSKDKNISTETLKDVSYILANRDIWLHICKRANMKLDNLKIINITCIDKILRRYEIHWKDLSGIKEENYGFTILNIKE